MKPFKPPIPTAIATELGWIHPTTGELLVSLRGLKSRIEAQNGKITEVVQEKNQVVEEVVQEVVHPTPNTTVDADVRTDVVHPTPSTPQVEEGKEGIVDSNVTDSPVEIEEKIKKEVEVASAGVTVSEEETVVKPKQKKNKKK